MTASELPPLPRLPSREDSRGRRPARKRALSREAIAAAALAIVDREGLDALTMRTVAHYMGTGAASLYAHVASKEELLELVIEQVIGEIELPGEPDPKRWQEQLKELARTIRTVFSRHRDLARASFARIPLGENGLRGTDWMIAVMRAGGLPDQVIAYACDLFPLYVTAVCYEESLYGAETSTEDMATVHRRHAPLLRRAAARALSERGLARRPSHRGRPRRRRSGSSSDSTSCCGDLPRWRITQGRQ